VRKLVIVVVWSGNRILSELITRNLVRRGFDVHEVPLPPSGVLADAPSTADIDAASLAIVDLDSQEPELWRRASQVRTAIPGIPLVILGHAWPTTAHLDRLQPCTYVRKPFAIDELLAAVQDVPMHVPSPS
jgi:DNA-binding response OmpR family regulator